MPGENVISWPRDVYAIECCTDLLPPAVYVQEEEYGHNPVYPGAR